MHGPAGTIWAAGLRARCCRARLGRKPHETGYLPGDSEEFIALWPGTPPGGEGIHLDLKVTDAVQPDGFHVRAVSQIQHAGLFRLSPGQAHRAWPAGHSRRRLCLGRRRPRRARDRAAISPIWASSAFVLRYRLPGEGWKNREMVPLQDAQRAMRLIRAGEYGVAGGWG